MDSCNLSRCAKVWPSTMATNHHDRFTSRASAIDIEGINSRLNTMSMEERSQGLNDLHGIADTPVETPEMLKTKIDEMNDALSSSGDSVDTLPYRTALNMDAAYVERLKIPCLRTTIFNSQDAAALMIRFFAHKFDLFGVEKLVRDLRLSDLDGPGEMEALREKGMAQILPERDRSGRVVLLNVGRVNQQYGMRVVLRVTLYSAMMACFRHDEETQKKGFIVIYFGFGQDKASPSRALAYHKLIFSLPIKFAANHVCRHDDSAGNVLKTVLKFATGLIEKRRLCRWRTHVGTQTEVMYSLMTFGISKEALPLTDNGELDLTNHHHMLDALKEREEAQARDEADAAAAMDTQHMDECDDGGARKSKNITINNGLVVGPMDILMGRGRQPTSLPGATTFRRVIVSYCEKYDAATKFEKQVITDVVLKQVKDLGCRFLKETAAGGYEECNDAVVRSKISHGFRNARIRTRIKEQQQKEAELKGGKSKSQQKKR